MTESSGPNNWNQKIIEEFRANAGRVGGYFEGAPMLLIHHIGARSGRERVNPLTYLPDGGDMIIAATKGGAPTNPDWYYNLKEIPESRSRSEPRPLQSMRQRSREKSATNSGAGSSSCDRVSPRTRPRHHVSFRCSG